MSNQVRIRLPRDPRQSWSVTQAVVARLVAAAEQAPELHAATAAAEAIAAGTPVA
jgi:hypothetical protein